MAHFEVRQLQKMMLPSLPSPVLLLDRAHVLGEDGWARGAKHPARHIDVEYDIYYRYMYIINKIYTREFLKMVRPPPFK